MKTSDRILELDRNKKSDSREVYALQKIIEYDDNHVEQFNVCTFDSCSENGEIYKEIEILRKIENEFCKYNKGFRSHKVTYRIIKVNMNVEEIYSSSDDYRNEHDWKVLNCENCKGNIYYGDKMVAYNGKTFCCSDCLIEYLGAEERSLFEDYSYDKLFTRD